MAGKRGRGGRPPLPASVKRRHKVGFMLTDAEFEQIKRAAALAGLSPGEYARVVTLDQPMLRPPVPKVNIDKWRELARTAANLNQIAYKLNSGLIPDAKRIESVLLETMNEVRRLRLALLGVDTDEDEDGGGDDPEA